MFNIYKFTTYLYLSRIPKFNKHLLEEDHFYLVYMSQTYLNLRPPIYSTHTLQVFERLYIPCILKQYYKNV